MQYDFVAIGDMVTDDFIELRDVRIDHEEHDGDKGYDEICLRFGDKIPYENSVVVPAVGNSANAAVSATRLGLKTAFISDTGLDGRGDEQMEALKENNVDTTYVRQHQGMPSNYHYVLRNGPERTILIKHAEFPYELPADMEPPKWIYFSSVGEHGLPYHHEIAKYVQDNNVKLAFQPGSFQISLGHETLKDIYAASELFFCNKEEAQRILGTEENNIPTLMKMVRELGPNIVCITDGADGAYAYDGAEAWFMPMYPDPAPPVDRTGAGDAFSSTFTAALASGHDLPTALAWGPINSMSVVQGIGAQEGLITKDQLETHLADAPANYVAKKINE